MADSEIHPRPPFDMMAYLKAKMAEPPSGGPAPEPPTPSVTRDAAPETGNMDEQPAFEPMPLLDILAMVRTVARRNGYAIAVHGSLSRDVDLVAVPWVDVTSSAEELVREIVEAGRWLLADPQPEQRPHGRLAWAIRWPASMTPGYLDLSIMPSTYTYDDVARRSGEGDRPA